MKPLGPIPDGFTARDGELIVGGRTARELVAQAGDTPLFVYAKDLISARVARLRSAMPDRLAIHYAVKANPYPQVLKLLSTLVDGFDVRA